MGLWLLAFLGFAAAILGFAYSLAWLSEAAEYMRKKKAEAEEEARVAAYRPAFLAGFNFAVGKGGLPPEIIDWPSAIQEVSKDHDPNCS